MTRKTQKRDLQIMFIHQFKSAYSVLLEQPFRFYLNTSDQRIVG